MRVSVFSDPLALFIDLVAIRSDSAFYHSTFASALFWCEIVTISINPLPSSLHGAEASIVTGSEETSGTICVLFPSAEQSALNAVLSRCCEVVSFSINLLQSGLHKASLRV